MKIKVESFWNGTTVPAHSEGHGFRALIPGRTRRSGTVRVLVYSDRWDKQTASVMLDALEAEGLQRNRIRFVHAD